MLLSRSVGLRRRPRDARHGGLGINLIASSLKSLKGSSTSPNSKALRMKVLLVVVLTLSASSAMIEDVGGLRPVFIRPNHQPKFLIIVWGLPKA